VSRGVRRGTAARSGGDAAPGGALSEAIDLVCDDASDAALDVALDAWWGRLLAHAVEVADADCVVTDAWADTGRLIGHVQREDEPIGADRGLRVVLRFSPLGYRAYEDDFSADAVDAAREDLFRAFERSRKRRAGRFADLWGALRAAWTARTAKRWRSRCCSPDAAPGATRARVRRDLVASGAACRRPCAPSALVADQTPRPCSPAISRNRSDILVSEAHRAQNRRAASRASADATIGVPPR
jgi:hypothetical protein